MKSSFVVLDELITGWALIESVAPDAIMDEFNRTQQRIKDEIMMWFAVPSHLIYERSCDKFVYLFPLGKKWYTNA